jgi:hypothetical protein
MNLVRWLRMERLSASVRTMQYRTYDRQEITDVGTGSFR